MIDWIKQNKVEAITLALIIAVALFLRLYRIDEYMTFLGDEGRDARIVRDLITKGNLVFIGPQTSVGNMYLGPLYYYMMAPALFLSRLNPVGPAIMNAILGTVTIFFTWYAGRVWFGKTAGVIASLLFAISPVAIIYSRSSWNPNPMPFFALVSIWGIYQVRQKLSFKWLPWVGISFAAAMQMHYLGLLLAPTLGIFWYLTFLDIKKDTELTKVFWRKTILAIILFLLLMSPLFLFDIKHNFLNVKALGGLLGGSNTAFEVSNFVSRPFVLISLLVNDLLLAGTSKQILINLIISLPMIFYLFQDRKSSVTQLLIVWLSFTVIGLSFYKNSIYIHYLGLVFPAVFILFGVTLSRFLEGQKYRKYISILLAFLISTHLMNTPLRAQPNNQLLRTEKAVDLIIKESKGVSFNFGLIAKNNYDESYRYFLENKQANFITQGDKIADQLYVICEDGEKCSPEGHSQYQIAIFGIAKISDEWKLDHLRIFKLIHPQQ